MAAQVSPDSGRDEFSSSPLEDSTSSLPAFEEKIPTSPSGKRSTRFYFDDRHITFKVEDDLLKIPIRHFIVHAPDVFQGMIEQKPPLGEEAQGASDDNPVILAGVALKDFEALVAYFNQDLSDFSDSKEEWISILRLADMWSMERIRRIACENLYDHSLGAIEMLELARKYHVPFQWAAPAFHHLVTRPTGLTPEWAAAIAYVQHQNRAQFTGNYAHYYNPSVHTAQSVLDSITAALESNVAVVETQLSPSSTFPNGPPMVENESWGKSSSNKQRKKNKGKKK
ncbi:hypothetical protein DL96DRAFT_1607484 [Flagelloscypha sp. PMI_526]|nr:hypothetical protein DL96DRAFT_1607484 [Flagelloscypha sp. PMI_526]